MKFGRLFFGGLTAIFLLVLAGVEAIYAQITRQSLQLQLDAHANETAASVDAEKASPRPRVAYYLKIGLGPRQER